MCREDNTKDLQHLMHNNDSESNIGAMKNYLKRAQNLMSFGNICAYEVKNADKDYQMLLSVGPRGLTIFNDDSSSCRRISYIDLVAGDWILNRFTLHVLEKDVPKQYVLKMKRSSIRHIIDAINSYTKFFRSYHLYQLQGFEQQQCNANWPLSQWNSTYYIFNRSMSHSLHVNFKTRLLTPSTNHRAYSHCFDVSRVPVLSMCI